MLQSLAIPAAVPETADSQLLEWTELRSSGGLLSAYRAKVPGGWLLYVGDGYHHHGGVTFYPDPGHLWTGESLT
jgi:hypothetical protein